MLLLEEGVPSTLRRAAGFDVPDMLAAGPRDVLVPESGLEVAREVLLQSDIVDRAGSAPPGTSAAAGPALGCDAAARRSCWRPRCSASCSTDRAADRRSTTESRASTSRPASPTGARPARASRAARGARATRRGLRRRSDRTPTRARRAWSFVRLAWRAARRRARRARARAGRRRCPPAAARPGARAGSGTGPSRSRTRDRRAQERHLSGEVLGGALREPRRGAACPRAFAGGRAAAAAGCCADDEHRVAALRREHAAPRASRARRRVRAGAGASVCTSPARTSRPCTAARPATRAGARRQVAAGPARAAARVVEDDRDVPGSRGNSSLERARCASSASSTAIASSACADSCRAVKLSDVVSTQATNRLIIPPRIARS